MLQNITIIYAHSQEISCVRKIGHTTKCREHRPLGEGVQRSMTHPGALLKFDCSFEYRRFVFCLLPLCFSFFALFPFPLSCLTFMFFPLLLLSCWGSKQTPSKPRGLSTQVRFSKLPDHRSFWIWLLKSATTRYCLQLWPEDKVGFTLTEILGYRNLSLSVFVTSFLFHYI